MFIVNLSMLGKRPTGLGVYAQKCADVIFEKFVASVISGMPRGDGARVYLDAPSAVSLGKSRFSAIRRWLWLRTIVVPKGSLVYSPTHHGLPNVDAQIITIHDLIALRYPLQHWQQYLYFKFMLPRLLRKCRAVFTVSETTKFDIIEKYYFPADNICVVPNCIDRNRFQPKCDSKKEGVYLLMVGAQYPHKNLEEVIVNGELWREKYTLKVVSCSERYRVNLKGLIEKHSLRDRIEFLDYVSDSEIVDLYQNAAALVYPSLWEGFGIPPLEALACGVPVIVSDIPVHREVLGDVGIFVSLGEAASWARAFQQLEGFDARGSFQERVGFVLDKYSQSKFEETLVNALSRYVPCK